jgi:hypothetical protein
MHYSGLGKQLEILMDLKIPTDIINRDWGDNWTLQA